MQFCDASNKLTALNVQVCQQTQTTTTTTTTTCYNCECINRYI